MVEAQGKNTWSTVPWLFAESVASLCRSISFDPQCQLLDPRCYLYIRLAPSPKYPISDHPSDTGYSEAFSSKPKS